MSILGDVSNRDKATLLEFPVTPSTECSRVSSRSYVFTLDTDSLLITFANETGEPPTRTPIFVDRRRNHEAYISIPRISKEL